jgi:hypothetical protein
MIETSCDCNEGFGLPHSHRFHMGIKNGTSMAIYDLQKDGIRMWIDYKQLARELCNA